MPVQLTKREAAWLLGELTGTTTKGKSQREAVLKKLRAPSAPARPTGLGVQQAVAAFEAGTGYGNTIAVPTNATEEWYGKIGARIRQLGLTEAQCRAIGAWIIKAGWDLPVQLETLVWGAPKWLLRARQVERAREAPLPPEDL